MIVGMSNLIVHGAPMIYFIFFPDKRDQPNVRSLNTLLRGCLWSAATIGKDATTGEERLWGGVVSSEEAWKACVHISKYCFDASSYEYYIIQLCFALRLQEAESILKEMKQRLRITSSAEDTFMAEDASTLETLAVALLALARGYALIGENSTAQDRARSIISALDAIEKINQNETSFGPDRGNNRSVQGGEHFFG